MLTPSIPRDTRECHSVTFHTGLGVQLGVTQVCPGPSRSNGAEPGFPKPGPGVPRAPGAPGTRSRCVTHLSPGMDTVDHWKIRAVRARSTTPLNITSFASTRALRNSLAARKARKEANLLGCAWQYDKPLHSNQKDARKSTNPRGACVCVTPHARRHTDALGNTLYCN